MRDGRQKVKIEGAMHTLSRVGNGGAQAVEAKFSLIWFREIRFQNHYRVMPLELWRTVCKYSKSEDTMDRLFCESRSNPEPDLTGSRVEPGEARSRHALRSSSGAGWNRAQR